MMITLVLSSNMKRMIKDNILVRKLVGIETSGNINILFTDKTGTLTKGKLEVINIMSADFKEYRKEKWTVLINPSPTEIEEAIQRYRLVGYNNLRYDNHIVYAAMQGYNTMQLYRLSQSIINGDSQTSRAAQFREAKNISEADIYDICAIKMSLKKWEIELGDDHIENKYDWDEPLPVDKWNEIIEYCKNNIKNIIKYSLYVSLTIFIGSAAPPKSDTFSYVIILS